MEVKQISKRKNNLMYEVGEYVVRIFTKPGRRLMTCTCFNGTKFCNEPTLCKHKEQVIIWKYLNQELGDKLI